MVHEMKSTPYTLLRGAARPWAVLALLCGGFTLHPGFRHAFWTTDFLGSLPQQASTNIILAAGMTCVILTGGIDLSVGSLVALCGVSLGLTVTVGPPLFMCVLMAFPIGVSVAALLYTKRLSVLDSGATVAAVVCAVVTAGIAFGLKQGLRGGIQLETAILCCLLTGAGFGLLNGLLISLGRIPPFVVTLGTFTAARGLTVYATDGNSVTGLPHRLEALSGGWPLYCVLAVVVIGISILLTRTRPGRYIYAIGGSEEASRLTGVDTITYKTFAYAISGLCAAVGAILLTAKFMVADTGAGAGAELNAIAAVVIGGTALQGGRGTVQGALIGALSIAVLNAALVLTVVPDTLQGVVIGSVIVGTVFLDRRRSKGS